MTDRAELIEKLNELAELTPPICNLDKPGTIEQDWGETTVVYCKPFEEFQELVKQAADTLREQDTKCSEVVTKSGWISVEEQQPKRFVNVLCYCPNKDYGSKIVISYNESKESKEGAYFADQHLYGEVTHWMPLPEPPERGAEE